MEGKRCSSKMMRPFKETYMQMTQMQQEALNEPFQGPKLRAESLCPDSHTGECSHSKQQTDTKQIDQTIHLSGRLHKEKNLTPRPLNITFHNPDPLNTISKLQS